jgi:hypothetical protein
MALDPITGGLILGGISVVGSLIADAMSRGDRELAEALRQQAMRELSIDLPTVDAIAIQPGIVESQAAKAQGSLEAQQTRMDALRQLSRRAGEGYTVEDRAAINAALSEVAQQERGAREAILRKLPAQSGAQIGAMLANQQAAAQQASQMGLDVAAQGRRRALEAIAQTGKLAGDIDVAAFEQAFQRGQAADVISKFNEANRLETAARNEANRLAQENRRTDLLAERARAKAQALAGMGGTYEGRGQRTQQSVGGVTQGVSSFAGAAMADAAEREDPIMRLRKKRAEEELKRLGGA